MPPLYEVIGVHGEHFHRLLTGFHKFSLAILALFSTLEPECSFQNSNPYPSMFCSIFWNRWSPIILIIVSKSSTWPKGSVVRSPYQPCLSRAPLFFVFQPQSLVISRSLECIKVYLTRKSLYIQFTLLKILFHPFNSYLFFIFRSNFIS